MKKIMIISVLALFACTKEEIKKQPAEQESIECLTHCMGGDIVHVGKVDGQDWTLGIKNFCSGNLVTIDSDVKRSLGDQVFLGYCW